MALAVHKDLDYVKVKIGEEIFIVAQNRLQQVIGTEGEVIEQLKGSALVGLSYSAPFSYIQVVKGHTIHHGDFVTSESGTGIVHIAPAYGEDDYRLVQENNLSFVHVVDERGRYKECIPPLAGAFVKDGEVDVEIIKVLHQKGLLFHKEKYEHSYPHCWRCDTALLYYATESWFIKTTAVKEMLITRNQEVTWHPEHIKDGRFGKFLDGLVDWNISRNRYWGTPLNVWQCTSCQKEIAPKSIAQVKKYTKAPFDQLELHKPYVDELVLTCPSCSGEMYRTPEVIDVWFDSGSMPFAQYHTPFENNEVFQRQFPADVIVEGIDQTRGWFYSLLAVSVLYTGKVPYKNMVATGHAGMSENKISAFQTLYTVLTQLSQLLAPFIPFTSESIYLALTGKSVHLTNFPSKNSERMNKQLEEQMEQVKEIVELGRSLRHRFQLKTKQPLATLLIFSATNSPDIELIKFEPIIKDELNVKSINWIDSQDNYVQYSLKLNFQKTGPKLGSNTKQLKERVQTATQEEINFFRNKGYLTFQLESKESVTLAGEEILLQRKTNLPGYHEASNKNFTVMLDTTVSVALKKEGNIRELIRSIQDLRKEKNLPVDKKIDLYIDSSSIFKNTMMEYHSLIHKGVILHKLLFERIAEMKEIQIDGEIVYIGLK